MIEEVVLKNFISHNDPPPLLLEPGVNIFVGNNGSGKSSVIDGITYALFGRHTRAAVRNIIRRGAAEGGVIVRFSIAGKRYSAERKFGSTGTLESAGLKEVTTGAKFGYDDTEFGQLEIDKTAYDTQLKEALGNLNTVESEIKTLEERERMVKERLVALDPLRIKVTELDTKRGELKRYVGSKKLEL